MPFRKPYRTKRPYRKKRFMRKRKSPFTTARRRLRGIVKQPYFRYSRARDLPITILSGLTETVPGLWVESPTTTFNDIPAAATLAGIYRFFRIKKVIIQYTPDKRSDEYAKVFPWPQGGGGTGIQPFYTSFGGALEIKQINSSGYLTPPTTWEQAMNRSGKLKKCATTKSFTRTVYPRIHQILEDYASTDPMRLIKAPFLSTDNASNLDVIHYLGIDVFHSINNISYDSSLPLNMSKRYVYSIEFKGLKI